MNFVSGQPIGLSDVLKEYNRREFHHCYPRKYLKSIGIESAAMNRLANFVFLSSADNKILGGDAPSVYRDKMPENVDEILKQAAVPASLFNDDYEAFIKDRGELLAAVARKLRDDAAVGEL